MVNLRQQIIALVATEFAVPLHQLDPRIDLRSDLGVDSIDRLAFAMGLEERFGIHVDDTALGRARTVGDVIELVVTSKG